MTLTKVSGGILQQPIDVGIITATSIQVGSGTTIHDTGIDLGSGNITSHNINSTGIITSTGLDVNGNGDISGDLSVSGNVSIGGTLTYEDVTNIDSVGVITARNDINIENATPTLNLIDTDGSTTASFLGNSGNIFYSTSSSNRDHIFRGSTTEVVRITGDGNIGIGTDNALNGLDILQSDGRTRVTSFGHIITQNHNNSTTNYWSIAPRNGGELDIAYGSPDGNGTVSADKLTITTAGDVGIGTDNPSQSLDVAGNTTIASNGRVNIYRPTSTATNTAFQINSNVGATDSTQFIIQTGGNVGIGTDNPDTSLRVVESDLGSNVAAQSNDIAIFERNNNGYIKVLSPSDKVGGIAFGDTNDSFIGAVRYDHNDNNLNFYVNNAERLRIKSDGNIGIGQTNPQSKLQIENAGEQLRLTYPSIASYIHEVKSNGDYAIDKDGTERLRVTTGGNIGIGTTNPGSKLAVHGSITESTDGVTYYPVVTQQDIGLDQNQIPLNQNLGGMAYMDTSNYEQVFEIPATDVTSYFKEGTENIYIGMEGHAPSSVAWPSGSLNQIDVWEIDFQLTYPNLTSGRNDLWMLMYYHNGSSITQATSVEWNNWVLARTTYAGTNTGWNQIQSAVSTNWGKLANYMDAKLFSGKILFYRGGTNDFTGSNAGQRTGVMWQFNYTHGGVGSTLAFGSAHPTVPSPSQPLAGFTLNADPENAGTVDSNGNSQVFGGYIRQKGFRLQGNI